MITKNYLVAWCREDDWYFGLFRLEQQSVDTLKKLLDIAKERGRVDEWWVQPPEQSEPVSHLIDRLKSEFFFEPNNHVDIALQTMSGQDKPEHTYTPEELSIRYHSTEHPNYPMKDWRHDIMTGASKLGYWEWVQAHILEEVK